ncbi:MAG: DUF2764 family protein [Chlamydiota bacterium]
MSRSFFVGSALPPLQVGKELEWTFDDLMVFFALNLTRAQKSQVDQIRQLIDLTNVRQILREKPLDPHGRLTEKELDEALVHREGLPDYLYTHLDAFDSAAEQERHYARVLIAFFHEMKEKTRGFLQFYFSFEREWRLVLLGLRAKRMKMDLTSELQYEDFTDPLVAELLAQKDTKQFEFPFEYRDLGNRLEGTEADPLAEHRVLTKYQFDTIGEQFCDDPFSGPAILGYFVQFMLIEDDNHLNDSEGSAWLNRIATLK